MTKCQAREARTQQASLTAPDAVHQIAGEEVKSLLDMRSVIANELPLHDKSNETLRDA